jgi:hypothetical protein
MSCLTSAGKSLEAKGSNSILFRVFCQRCNPYSYVGYTLHFLPRSEGLFRQDVGNRACEEFRCLHHHL